MSAPRRLSSRGTILFGVIVAGGFLGGLGAWSATVPLAGAVVAPATAVVESSRQRVAHRDGGIVAEVLVRDGSVVRRGDTLLRMDGEELEANRVTAAGLLSATVAEAARLRAELDGAERMAVPASEHLLPDDFIAEVELFEQRLAAFRARIAVVEGRRAQALSLAEGLRAQLAAERAGLTATVAEIEAVAPLVERGFERRPRLHALERQASELRSTIARLQTEIARAREDAAQTDLALAEMREERLREVAEGLRRAAQRRVELEGRLALIRSALARLDVRAPIDGVVVGQTARTVGGVVGPGEVLLELVPLDDRLVFEARIDVGAIDEVRPGMAATLRFTAFGALNAPAVDGIVTRVSADRLTDERTGMPYYVVTVEPAEPSEAAAFDLVPGMPAEAHIRTRDRSAIDYLLAPLSRAVGRAMRES